jgi:UDP-glucose 4-epimerase
VIHLITGGAGFVGSHLADALADHGDEVVILDDLSTGRVENVRHLIDAGQTQLIEGSVLDATLVNELMAQADSCFHLASPVGVKLICSQPLDSILNMVRGTDVVMASAALYRTRLVFTSTSEIYGKNGGEALHEDSDRVIGPPTKSRWSYATAKVFGEILAHGYTHGEGARMTVARLFNTVGPRQSDAYGMVLPRFVRQALDGADLTVYGDGTQSRCFTHVHDTIGALVGLAESDDAIGEVFNIGDGQPISIAALARRVRERIGSDSAIRFVPYAQAYGDGFEELGRRRPDCRRIRNLTEWRPLRSVDDAIDDVIAYERGEWRQPATDFGVARGVPSV